MTDKPIAYVSSPGFNESQRTGVKKILETIREAGYEPYIPVLTCESPPQEEVAPHISALQNSAVVVAWLDGLNPKGVSTFEVCAIETKMNAALDPDTLDALVMGLSRHPKYEKKIKALKQRKGLDKKILMPGELHKGVEVTAEDLGIKGTEVDFAKQGKRLCKIRQGPLNFPDSSVLFELGYAFATRKPVFALAMADPILGMYAGWTPSVTCDRFSTLGGALKAFRESGGVPFPDLLASLREKHGVDLLAAPVEEKECPKSPK